jgi:mRNA interferase YafQ
MMLTLKYSQHFKRDLKRYRFNQEVLLELKKVLNILTKERPLPPKNLNHRLVGEFKNCFDCHLKPDVAMIYKIEAGELSLLLLRIGSHTELF